MLSRSSLTYTAAFVFCATASSAQPPVNPQEPILVSATLLPQPAEDVASSASIITAKQIAAHNYQTVAAALQTIPGLSVSQTGGPGGLTSVYIRGTNSNHVKVLLDGVDISDPSAGDVFDFSQLSLASIAKIEVLRGPQSGLYGSDALGGVIAITTKQPLAYAPPRIQISADGGSFGTTNQAATFTDWFHGLATTLSYSHAQTAASETTPWSDIPAGQARHADYSDRKNVTLNLADTVNPHLTLGATAHYTIAQLNATADAYSFATGLSQAEPKHTYGTNREIFLRGYAQLTSFNEALTQRASYAFTHYDRRIADPNYTPIIPNLYSGARTALDYTAHAKLGYGQILVFGSQYSRESITDNTPIRAHTHNAAGFAELDSQFTPWAFNTLAVRIDANSQFGHHVTFREAPVIICPVTQTRLHTSVGTGFAAPTLNELYQSYPAWDFYANPNLKPESSLGWDIGIDQPFTLNHIPKALSLGATYYHNRISNLITENATYTSYANVGRATTSGIESYISYRPSRAFTVQVDYTYLNAMDDNTHTQLLRRPKNKVTVTATWAPVTQLTLAADVIYNGVWSDVSRDGSQVGVHMPGFTLLNLSASYQFMRNIAFYARGSNLLNEHYADPDGFLAPGAAVFGGIRVSATL